MLGERKYFDVKIGSLCGLVMGGIVYYINKDHGMTQASIAAAKQATYTFLIGGSMTSMCEYLVNYFRNSYIARTISTVIPSAITILLTYGIHSLKGTPEPFESTVPTILLGPPAFAFWSHKKRLEKIISETDTTNPPDQSHQQL